MRIVERLPETMNLGALVKESAVVYVYSIKASRKHNRTSSLDEGVRGVGKRGAVNNCVYWKHTKVNMHKSSLLLHVRR